MLINWSLAAKDITDITPHYSYLAVKLAMFLLMRLHLHTLNRYSILM